MKYFLSNRQCNCKKYYLCPAVPEVAKTHEYTNTRCTLKSNADFILNKKECSRVKLYVDTSL